MSERETGGSAFPRAPFDYTDTGSDLDWNVREQTGMTLRDWFAGQALAGCLAMPEGENGSFHTNCGDQFIGVAKYAYQMADAMIKARNE